jgi:uroporphyrinogen-III decarboxylase
VPEKSWTQLSSEEKKEIRFKRWLSTDDIHFIDSEARQSYDTKVKRLSDVIRLVVPDRVPVVVDLGFFPARYSGLTPQTVMYDYEKMSLAWGKMVTDFELDTFTSPMGISPGLALEIVDYKVYRWPGHGVPPKAGYQCVEAEYMKADEYDDLIRDPSDFWLRTYLPRVFGTLNSFSALNPFTNFIEMPFTGPGLAAFGNPEVKSALMALIKAGEEAVKWSDTVSKCNKRYMESGLPALAGGSTKAPFDCIGDTLRGTQGIIMDMYRQPEKVLKACDIFVPMEIKRGVTAANKSGVPVVRMPLHKGADGFMSAKQFEIFYWPSLKKVIMGLIDEGLVPLLFAEGGYNSRLEVIRDLPEGKVAWHFDQTDMRKAKEILGGKACIMGNVPSSLLVSANPQAVKSYCKDLIEIAGKGGGFILASGVVLDEGKPENIRAMTEAAREYGVY